MAEELIETKRKPEELPFVAPCRQISMGAPINWLKLGWQDIKTAPKQSLTYGLVVLLLSCVISYFAWEMGSVYLLAAMLSGFVFIGPVLAIGLYSISKQIQYGYTPQLGYCIRQERRHLSNELVIAFILLIILLVWARAATAIHIFFPVNSSADIADFAVFLTIGSSVGLIFVSVVFCASAFSLPMIMDKQADAVTAVLSSINAILRNKGAMFVWALLIVLLMLLSFATALLGLVVLMPLIGHATWHGYKEVIDASEWPDYSKTDE